MDVHVLNGNGFGGVESLFFHVLTNHNELNIKLIFLGGVPNQFTTNGLRKYLIFKKDIKKYRRKIRVLIPHADYKSSIWLLYCRLILGIKVMPVSHGVIRHGTKNHFISFGLLVIKLALNKLVFKNKIAISKMSGLDYFLGDFKVISYTPENKKFVPKKGEPVNRPIRICCVGRFHSSWKIVSAKNQEFVFKVLQKLDERKVKYEMLFIGEGEDYNSLFSKYPVNGLIKRISHTNKDIRFIHKSDLLLAPSLHESFGQAILWSQLVGTKALVSRNVCDEVNIGGCIYLGLKDENLIDWCEEIQYASRNLIDTDYESPKIEKHLIYKNYLTKIKDEADCYYSQNFRSN